MRTLVNCTRNDDGAGSPCRADPTPLHSSRSLKRVRYGFEDAALSPAQIAGDHAGRTLLRSTSTIESDIRANARRLNAAFSQVHGFKEYFAVKALPNPFILKI